MFVLLFFLRQGNRRGGEKVEVYVQEKFSEKVGTSSMGEKNTANKG